MKFITLALLLALTQLLALEITLAPYITKAYYKDVSKDSSDAKGFYTKFNTLEHALELNYEKTALDYNDTALQLKQNDYTISYSQNISDTYKIKALYHQISASTDQNLSAKVYLLDLQFYKKNRFNVGAIATYSSYGSSALANDVYQAQAYAGFTYGDYRSLMGRYILKTDATIIYPKTNDSNSTLSTQYSSLSVTLKQYKGDFINTLGGWIGERIYAVEDHGFTVYNLNELHTSGFYLSSRYAITKNFGLQLSYTNERFEDLNINIDDSMKKYLFSLDYTIR